MNSASSWHLRSTVYLRATTLFGGGKTSSTSIIWWFSGCRWHHVATCSKMLCDHRHVFQKVLLQNLALALALQFERPPKHNCRVEIGTLWSWWIHNLQGSLGRTSWELNAWQAAHHILLCVRLVSSKTRTTAELLPDGLPNIWQKYLLLLFARSRVQILQSTFFSRGNSLRTCMNSQAKPAAKIVKCD